MMAISLMANSTNTRFMIAPLLLLGVTLCTGNATPNRDKRPESIATVTARQSESPAFIREATFGIADETDNCTADCITLNRIILRNRSDTPITAYRLGLVIMFANPKKPTEVHLGNTITLIKSIGPKQEREFSDNLASPVPTSPTIKMICYFVAEVHQEGDRIFSEDADKIAAEYDQALAPSKAN